MLPPYLDTNIIQPISFDCQEEIWAPINYQIHKDVRPIYFVSTHGRVFSHAHDIFLKREITNAGYYRINLMRIENVNKPKHYSVHRLVLETFHPVYNLENLVPNHKDGNKLNNFLCNLEWVTQEENVQHAIYNNLAQWKTGDSCSWSTITSEQADQIGYLLSLNKYIYNEIANMVGCSTNVVKFINLGISWRFYYEKYQLWKNKELVNDVINSNQLIQIISFIKENSKLYSDNIRAMCIDISTNILRVKMNKKYL